MNILSLFDGISCGQVAFNKIGIEFDGINNKYFASEICEDSIMVTKHNYPNTVHLGDITKITEIKLRQLPKMDFLIGGALVKTYQKQNHKGKD